MADPDFLSDLPSAPPGQGGVIPGTQNVPTVGPETRTSAGNIQVPRTRAALDAVAGGVFQNETGNKHVDENGKVILGKPTSTGERPVGKGQILPSTAAGLGIDPYDEKQNEEGTKKYLGQLFDKYGNWDDSLAAYDAGPKRVDDWIAAGRPESGRGALPQETKNYVPSALSNAGMSDVSPTSIVASKRRLGASDFDDMMKGVRVGNQGPVSEDDKTTMDLLSDTSKFVGKRVGETEEYLSALYHGAQQGVRDLVAGPIQFGLERTSPQLATQFTNMLNAYDDQFEGPKKHPVFASVGNVIGTTLGIVVGGEAAGALKVGEVTARLAPQIARTVAQVWNRIGTLGRGAAVGGLAGATEFNAKPQEQSRIIEGVLGAAFGGLTAGVGGAIWRGAQRIADRNSFRDFVNTVRDVVGDVTASTSKIKDRFVEQWDRNWTENRTRYELRDREGRQLAPGFPREEMGNPIKETMDGTRQAGVAPTSTTRSVAGQVDRELGGPEARALQAQHEAAQTQYDKDLKAWIKQHNGGQESVTPQRMALLQQRIDQGAIPPLPVHPGEFEAPPITPEQFASARQALQGVRARARDGATRRQLGDMRANLEAAAKDAAETAGVSVDEFLRRARGADTFYRENLRPMIDAFKTTRPQDLSPSKFWDRVVSLVEGNDTDALRGFARMLGPTANAEMGRVLAYRMFEQMQTAARSAVRRSGERGVSSMAAKMSEYVHRHAEAIRTLGGRDLEQQLLGMANIADRLAQNPNRYAPLFHALTSHRWLQALGVAEVGMGIVEGEGRRTLLGVGMIVAPWAGHVLYQVLTRAAELPGLLPVIRRAERTPPGSPEMDRLMAEFQKRVLQSAAVGARTVAPVGGPARDLPAALGGAVRSLPF